MPDFTPVARLGFSRVNKRLTTAADNAESFQRKLLGDLLSYAKSTEWGNRYNFSSITSYEDYRSRLPIIGYEDIRSDVMRMVMGESDILWPGTVKRYAQSSGTSGGRSKYIPLTDRSLRRCHFSGGADVVARYLANNPASKLFSGQSFILGGSYANSLNLPPHVFVGDLSASLIDKINPVANLFRIPSKDIALIDDWSVKLPKLVRETSWANVTSISGVPSWFLTVIQEVMKSRGVDELHEAWPDLEVFFHGGISFKPYRSLYDRLIDPSRMKYMETYNASEGFFALQDNPEDNAMLLLMDTDVLYEFVPISQVDSDSPHALAAWEISPNQTYALVITSSNGLWRYMIGDTVTVKSINPVRITIAGRTRSFINAFGEELMVFDADTAITKACRETHAEVTDYTVAPVYAAEKRGRHQWLIAFDRLPSDMNLFAEVLDKALCNENSDYQAKRSGNIFLDPPEIVPVSQAAFNKWLSETGKLGGQRKIPRLVNDRSVADAILQFVDITNL